LGRSSASTRGRLVTTADRTASRCVAFIGQRVDARFCALADAPGRPERGAAAGRGATPMVLALHPLQAGGLLQSPPDGPAVVVPGVLQDLLRGTARTSSASEQRAEGCARRRGPGLRARPPASPSVRRLRRDGSDRVGVRPRPETSRRLDIGPAGRAPGVLVAEMAQCEVVCASCHRRRTARRGRWRRLEADLSAHPPRSEAHLRNLRVAHDALAASGCVDCGETDVCVLDFDHVGEKVATITQLVRREVGLRRLREEMERCEVRCANCHRRRTAVVGGHYRARAEVPPARVELALRG
jgi:5-methylcytosine-specific restriction endonuclease McrA